MLSTLSCGCQQLPALVFFHGFLGCKEDFLPLMKILEKDFFCLSIDLPGHGSSKCEVPLQDIYDTIQSFSLNSPLAVGYSLGGRILLEIDELFPNLFQRLFFFSSHPGLSSIEEKLHRMEKENDWILKLKNIPFSQFLEEWYSQPLFKTLKSNTSLYAEILNRRQNQIPEHLSQILDKFRLSKQKEYLSFSKPAFFFYGDQDTDYLHLYQNKKWQVPIEKISQSGHAVHIENPLECARKIIKCLPWKIPT